MHEIFMDWAKQQLRSARVRKPVGDAVVSLLDSVESLRLSEENRKKAVELFSLLALGHPVVGERKGETWVAVRPGNIRVGEEVRVKFDAFDGRLGTLHNGRRGVVVAVRYGDVVVKTNDGREPVLNGVHYPPQTLEKLVTA